MEAGFDIYVNRVMVVTTTKSSWQREVSKYPGDKTVTSKKASDLIAMLFLTLPIFLPKDGIVLGSTSFLQC